MGTVLALHASGTVLALHASGTVLALHASGTVLALHASGMTILIGLHRRNCSLADRALGPAARKKPAAREPALSAPAAADKQEGSAQHR
jgi:hypothetical protein